MKKILFSILVLSVCATGAHAFRKKPITSPPVSRPPSLAPAPAPARAPAPAPSIPSSLTGSFDLLIGYQSGLRAGWFGYGTVTVSSSGLVAFSFYLPSNGQNCSGTGTMSSAGLFTLSTGASGSAVIYNSSLGFGNFSDGTGSGLFGVRRR